MRCTECGKPLRVTGNVHRYDECGLPNVVLHGVQVRECAECGEVEVAIPNIEGLHRAIAVVLATRPSSLAPEGLRFIRQYLGFSSQDFAAMLGTRAETLSRWENGKQPVPSTVDRAARLMVLTRDPIKSYDLSLLGSIRPAPQRPAKIDVKLQGAIWEPAKAA